PRARTTAGDLARERREIVEVVEFVTARGGHDADPTRGRRIPSPSGARAPTRQFHRIVGDAPQARAGASDPRVEARRRGCGDVATRARGAPRASGGGR